MQLSYHIRAKIIYITPLWLWTNLEDIVEAKNRQRKPFSNVRGERGGEKFGAELRDVVKSGVG